MDVMREAQSDHSPAISAAACDLTVIIPTFNEVENVELMVDALHQTLDGVARWEAVFVDDNSPDGTAERVKSIARRDPHVRCIHRIGRTRAVPACIEGALSSAADYVAVIDGDLQHDETRLPIMLETARNEDVDVVVGSRYVEGGGVGEWDQRRADISKFATKIASLATKVELSDPMSGFFLIKRKVFLELTPGLSAMGFKILLDLFATSNTPLSFKEVPFQFRTRQHGESKLDNQAAWDFLMLLADKTVGRFVPVRFISFGLIGGTGILLHMAIMAVVMGLTGDNFTVSKVWAVSTAIVSNYALNNFITYRDRRLTGMRWFTGLLSFAAVCALGAVADIGVSSYIYADGQGDGILQRFWQIPALIGIIAGSVWNYAVSSVYTWKNK